MHKDSSFEVVFEFCNFLYSLKEARDILSSASNWGLLDIFGGNGFTGFMKHMKIDKARKVLDKARQDLWEFRNELSYLPEININIDGFLTFADFFFDGFLSDVFVQSRINDAKRQLDEAIRRTESVLSQLRLSSV